MYKIIECPARIIDDCIECDGDADLREKVIKIFQGLSDIEKRKTFLHEVIHAVCAEYNVDNKLLDDGGDVVDTFSCGLWDTINRNGLWEIFK